MSHFFVKKGVMTSDVSKQVKVNFGASGVNKLEEEKKREKELEEAKQKLEREQLVAKRVYDFSMSLKEDEEQLDEYLGKKKALAREDAEVEEGSELSMLYEKGYKMLQSLGGYTNGGLGLNRQGITEFIKPEKRTVLGKKAHLDFAEEHPHKKKKKDHDLKANEKLILKSLHRWKKGFAHHEVPQSKQSEMVEVVEIEKDRTSLHLPALSAEPTKYKIIDMTKRLPIIIDSISTSAGEHSVSSESQLSEWPTPLLLLKKLNEKRVNIKSEKNFESKRKAQAEKQIIVNNSELVKCEFDLKAAKTRKDVIATVIALLGKIKALPDSSAHINSILKEFLNIYNLSEQLFEKHKLKDLMMQRMVKVYSNDLRNVERVFDQWVLDGLFVSFEICRLISKVPLCGARQTELPDERYEAFLSDAEYIVNGCLQPALVNYTMNYWDHEDPTELIKLFGSLERICPQECFFDLLDAVVGRVLSKRIEHWELDEALLYPHLWIQPWCPLLARDPKHRVQLVYERLKLKFRSLLADWTPEDKYAAKLLQPWKEILPVVMWDDILYLDVLPKIIFSLESFDPNPSSLKTESIAFFVEWSRFVPDELVEDVVSDYIVEKVRRIVQASKAVAEKDEIVEWVQGWMMHFEEANQSVQDILKDALCSLIVECWPST